MTTTVRKAASVFMAVLLCLGVAFSAAPGIFGGTAYAYTLNNGSMTDSATLTVSGAQEGGKVDAIKMFDAVPTTDGEGATYTAASEWNGFFTTENLGSDYNNDPYAYVQGLAKDKTKIAAFAAKAVKWMGNQSFTGTTVSVQNGGTATLTGLDYGYYLVLPYTGSVPAELYSDAMLLNVLEKNVTATVKAEWPTVDKTVAGDQGLNENNNGGSANVGDTLTYTLTSKVPDMTGYDSYVFKFVDTLSNGLSLLASSDTGVTVKIGANSELIQGTDFTVTVSGQQLTVDLSDYLTKNKSKLNAGDPITVTYEAKVKADAVVDGDGNSNEAEVVYSNDPSNPQDGTDESTSDKTYTYTFGFDLKKVVEKTETPLSGAKFEIYRDNGDDNWNDSDEKGLTFTGSGSNWKLAETQSGATELMTGADGLLSLDGLSEGTYWVLETAAPDGYNKLSEPIKVVISATYNEDGTLASHTISYGDSSQTDCGGGHVIKIENSKGTLLPETGGMGTIGLTVLGVIIVAAGAIWIVRRNRKGNQR